jgi:hypothetical protein
MHVSRAAFSSGDRQISAMRLALRFFSSASSFALTGMALLFSSETLLGLGAGVCLVRHGITSSGRAGMAFDQAAA